MEEKIRLTAVMAEEMRRKIDWYKSQIDSVSYRDYIDSIGIVEDLESCTIEITFNSSLLYWISVEYDGICESNYRSIANRLIMLFCGLKADFMDYDFNRNQRILDAWRSTGSWSKAEEAVKYDGETERISKNIQDLEKMYDIAKKLF